MKIRVLGCHGSDQLVARSRGSLQCGTCGFLVNGTVLVDAGTIGSRLLLDEQKQIRHVLLSHLHFDHIKDLPTLADDLVGGEEMAPVMVAGIPEVLKGLETHIFNDEVYPNFFKIPDPRQPVFRAEALAVGQVSPVSGLEVMPIAVNHVVPTVGFLISDGQSTLLYSGDTYQTEELWRVASRIPTLKAAFIETSFPNEQTDLAKLSKHLTPALLAEEVRKLDRPDVMVHVYHMKPRFREQIIQEIAALNLPHIKVLEEGQELLI